MDKEEFQRLEYKGAPLNSHHNFMCTKRLSIWLKTQSLIEGKDISHIIRRMLTQQAILDGYDVHGC
jgi:hypothetical protein